MAHHHLRKDTTCQNCGSTVTDRFCSHCGQENTETRQSFGHLLKHFAEDLTHYDTNFWLTMRYLLFRPAHLTKAFLQGKRNSFVPPVRLYIFISFVTFLLPFLLPDLSDDELEKPVAKHEKNDTVKEISSGAIIFGEHVSDYNSVAALDSAQALLPPHKRWSRMKYWAVKKYVYLHHYSEEELKEKFLESFSHNFPKALFFFMPLFAFVLWLFHNKKRWLYFDHAIFTLHYFSFILLVFNLVSIVSALEFISQSFFKTILYSFIILIPFAYFMYFLVAHKRMYGESRLKSVIKSIIIYWLNLLIFIFTLVCFAIISVFAIH